MQSKFEAIDECQFLTFVISFFPPAPSTISLPLLTTPITSLESGPGSSTKQPTCQFVSYISFAASASSSESGSASSSDSISQVCIPYHPLTCSASQTTGD